MNFNVLVDYDNVDHPDRRLGLSHVITKITSVISPQLPTSTTRVTFRLYGGWFQDTSPSRSAQTLGTAIAAYPSTASINGRAGVVQVEFARALFANPRSDLTHTFRPKGQAPRLSCEATPYRKCSLGASCPIKNIANFINQEQCDSSGCSVTPSDILNREEQKLVDTMIVSDIVYLATQASEAAIGVVSADYDIWPGIVSALVFGTSVVHVHPKQNYGIRKKRYAIPSPAKYIALSF